MTRYADISGISDHIERRIGRILCLSELDFKIKNGIDPLLDLFDKHGVTDKIDPARASVV